MLLVSHTHLLTHIYNAANNVSLWFQDFELIQVFGAHHSTIHLWNCVASDFDCQFIPSVNVLRRLYVVLEYPQKFTQKIILIYYIHSIIQYKTFQWYRFKQTETTFHNKRNCFYEVRLSCSSTAEAKLLLV